MKIENSQQTFHNSLVILKDNNWLERLRIAGKCLSDIMSQLDLMIADKADLSMLEISKFVESEIIKQECTPTFKGYKGFPEAVCISINKQLVHGIPTEYKLQDGDVASFDFGATYKGAIADSAITCIYGEPKSKDHIAILEATKNSLYDGIRAIRVGKRLGCIGSAINKSARSKGFRVIEAYGGHGIDEYTPHALPYIANKGEPTEGLRVQPGLTIAIEPMLVPGSSSNKTKVGDDGWAVYTEEIGAHFEHTIFVHEDKVEIITLRENEKI